MGKEQNVESINLWFIDILGILKSFAITTQELEGALERGVGFDGSSIQGFTRIDESDMVAMPDPDAFQLLSWKPRTHHAVARIFCDILRPGGEPFDGDPRYVLKRNFKRTAQMGYTFYIGPELEYFYFQDSQGNTRFRRRRLLRHDPQTLLVATDLRQETVLTLEEMCIGVECSHHEGAPSQHEIDTRYTEALTMADNVMIYCLVVK